MALAQEGYLTLDGGPQGGAPAGQSQADGVVYLVVELDVRDAVGQSCSLNGAELAVYLR